MFDGCVGKESTNARRRRCSTHTHTRRRRRRDREGLGGGRPKSPHKRRFPSASFTKERGTTSRRSGSAPSNRIPGCFFVLVVLPVVESMSGRRTSRAIVFAADGRARREIQPSNFSSVEAGRRGSAIRIGDGSRHAPAHHEYALYQYHRTNVTLKFIHVNPKESCY